jgi:uncharacterized membrane protein YfcA
VGIIVGILTGIFGVGGAFLLVPFMITFLDIDPTIAVGTTMALSMITGAYGFYGHAKLENFEPITTLVIGFTSAAATYAGKYLQDGLKLLTGDEFDTAMKILLLVLLAPIAIFTWFTADKNLRPLAHLRYLKIPPLINLPKAQIKNVSITLIVVFAIAIGLLKGLTAIGAGIIMVPILISAIGLPPHMAIGTSLGAIVISSIAGVIVYSSSGAVNWYYVGALLVGGLIGTRVGLSLVKRISATNLKKYFAIVLVVVALTLFGELLFQAIRG